MACDTGWASRVPYCASRRTVLWWRLQSPMANTSMCLMSLSATWPCISLPGLPGWEQARAVSCDPDVRAAACGIPVGVQVQVRL